jgi:hypothetical protein
MCTRAGLHLERAKIVNMVGVFARRQWICRRREADLGFVIRSGGMVAAVKDGVLLMGEVLILKYTKDLQSQLLYWEVVALWKCATLYVKATLG